MTLEEMDDGLSRLGLDLSSPEGQETRSRILSMYGETLVRDGERVCSRCDRSVRKCERCGRALLNSVKPLDAALAYLGRPNDVNLMSFMFLFAIPTWERDTGNIGTMEKKIEEALRRRMKLKENQKRGIGSGG